MQTQTSPPPPPPITPVKMNRPSLKTPPTKGSAKKKEALSHEECWSISQRLFKHFGTEAMPAKTMLNRYLRNRVGRPKQDVLMALEKEVSPPNLTCTKPQKGSSNSVMSNFEEEFSVAAAAAWQVKKLLTSDDTRNDVLKSPNLEMAFSAMRIISQVCIEQCVHRELFDIAPVLAYAAFALYMSLQNVDSTVNSNLSHENSLRQTSSSPEVSSCSCLLCAMQNFLS